MTILIVRDRASAGGGIFNYYEAVRRHLTSHIHFVDVGKPHSFYGGSVSVFRRFTGARLLCDWLTLLVKIVWFRPDLMHVNPGLDVSTFRSLRRDAINILIARLFRRRVLVFWRGWENSWCGKPEFPAGNRGMLCRIYKLAAAHVVLSERFKKDLLRWGFDTPIHVETTVVADECLTASNSPPFGKSPCPTMDAHRDQEPRPRSLSSPSPPRSGGEGRGEVALKVHGENPFAYGKTRTNLLYLSRVEVAKGVFELLDAYRILKSRNPAYTLTIAGDGPDLNALREYAQELELRDIRFTGFVSGEAKMNCYRKGSVFCFLSYTEGMPNAVLEALAMGLPVVSSNAGALADILRDGENGFIVPPLPDAAPKKTFDPLAVANAIEKLAQSPELYERMATTNWQYARQRFAAPVVARRLESIYRGLSSSEPVRSGDCSEPVRPVL